MRIFFPKKLIHSQTMDATQIAGLSPLFSAKTSTRLISAIPNETQSSKKSNCYGSKNIHKNTLLWVLQKLLQMKQCMRSKAQGYERLQTMTHIASNEICRYCRKLHLIIYGTFPDSWNLTPMWNIFYTTIIFVVISLLTATALSQIFLPSN